MSAILTVNGGSSSIKFALFICKVFQSGEPLIPIRSRFTDVLVRLKPPALSETSSKKGTPG